jgi:preprotein translocase subunit SecG
MTTVLLIIHLFVTLALIGVVLIQRSEGGGLGVGTSQGMGSFMSGRGTANLLTRTTAILGTAFFILSLGLALLNRGTTVSAGSSILDTPAARILPATPAAPTAPTSPAPTAPATPATPAPSVAPAAPATPAPASQTPSAPVTPAPNTDKP